MKVLVTGGDGFIGSRMVELLVEMGHAVRVVERMPKEVSCRSQSLTGNVDWLVGDCGEKVFAQKACDGMDLVYHFASSTNPATTWDDPVREVREGILPSVTLLEAAAVSGVVKFAFASSGGTVYGRNSNVLEEGQLLRPFNPHGIAKYAIELFAGAISERTSMNFDVYRISNPYGPYQFGNRNQGVCAVWMYRILNGNKIEVFGNRETKRDYIYIDDACRLMTHSLRSQASSGVYNISSGEAISILELLEIFKEVIPVEFDYVVEPRRQFDNIVTKLDNSLILSFFDEFKFKQIREGIMETWDWYSFNG